MRVVVQAVFELVDDVVNILHGQNNQLREYSNEMSGIASFLSSCGETHAMIVAHDACSTPDNARHHFLSGI